MKILCERASDGVKELYRGIQGFDVAALRKTDDGVVFVLNLQYRPGHGGPLQTPEIRAIQGGP